jgi:hypothetical protein
MNILKMIDGKKTVLGIALGIAGGLCPIFGAPLLACQIVSGAGALLALIGAQHKDSKIAEALATGRQMAQQIDDIRAGKL